MDVGDLIGDELHAHGEADDELVQGGGPGVQPDAGHLVLQGEGQALDGGVEGEGHHHEHRPGQLVVKALGKSRDDTLVDVFTPVASIARIARANEA